MQINFRDLRHRIRHITELYIQKNSEDVYKRQGETVSVPIGIDLSFFEKNKDLCITYDPEDIPLLLPKRAADSHKGDYGKILMITGSKGMASFALRNLYRPDFLLLRDSKPIDLAIR